jgi:hypothetical protein
MLIDKSSGALRDAAAMHRRSGYRSLAVGACSGKSTVRDHLSSTRSKTGGAQKEWLGCLEWATYMALIIKKADTVLMVHIF